MGTAANVVVGVVAALHVFFLVLEMFLWNTPTGRKVFKRTEEQARESAVLAANQGLYNGFLAAGLVWGLLAAAPYDYTVKLFFLSCVLVAGLFGAATASKGILFIQAIPAALGLALVVASHGHL